MPLPAPAASVLGCSVIVSLHNPANEATQWGVWTLLQEPGRMRSSNVQAWRVQSAPPNAFQISSGTVSYINMELHGMPAGTSMNSIACTCQAKVGLCEQDDGLEALLSARSGSPSVAGKTSQSLPPAGRLPGPGPGQPRPPAALCWTARRSSGPGWLPPPLRRAWERQDTPASTLHQWPHTSNRHC